MSKSIIDQKEVNAVSEDGETITYRFHLEQAEEVCTMLISAAGASGNKARLRDANHYIAIVLQAQAEMIEQGLHVRGIRAPDMMLDIEAFHQKFGLEYTGKPRILEPALFDFRKKFIEEELKEWVDEQDLLIEALTADDGQPDHRRVAMGLHQQLDALVDLTYVVLGAAYLQFGPEIFHEAWKRVQSANMAKVRAQSADESKRGSTFDVVKPQGWMPPDHHDLVKDHAHQVYRHQVEPAAETNL
jgi:predicted HAD superfamily Cof-like phosphohydrolase